MPIEYKNTYSRGIGVSSSASKKPKKPGGIRGFVENLVDDVQETASGLLPGIAHVGQSIAHDAGKVVGVNRGEFRSDDIVNAIRKSYRTTTVAAGGSDPRPQSPTQHGGMPGNRPDRPARAPHPVPPARALSIDVHWRARILSSCGDSAPTSSIASPVRCDKASNDWEIVVDDDKAEQSCVIEQGPAGSVRVPVAADDAEPLLVRAQQLARAGMNHAQIADHFNSNGTEWNGAPRAWDGKGVERLIAWGDPGRPPRRKATGASVADHAAPERVPCPSCGEDVRPGILTCPVCRYEYRRRSHKAGASLFLVLVAVLAVVSAAGIAAQGGEPRSNALVNLAPVMLIAGLILGHMARGDLKIHTTWRGRAAATTAVAIAWIVIVAVGVLAVVANWEYLAG